MLLSSEATKYRKLQDLTETSQRADSTPACANKKKYNNHQIHRNKVIIPKPLIFTKMNTIFAHNIVLIATIDLIVNDICAIDDDNRWTPRRTLDPITKLVGWWQDELVGIAS